MTHGTWHNDSIMTHILMTFSVITVSIMIFTTLTLSIMTLSTRTFSIMTFRMTTLSITAYCDTVQLSINMFNMTILSSVSWRRLQLTV